MSVNTTFSPQMSSVEYDGYDKAAARLFNVAKIVGDDGHFTSKPVPLIFASPDRVEAQARKRFRLSDDKNLPLPLISIQALDPQYDPSRHLFRGIRYRKVALNDDFTKSLGYPKPQPWNLQYTAEIWSKTSREARTILQAFRLQFDAGPGSSGGPAGYFRVDHGYPVGIKSVRASLDSVSDTSSIETGEEERMVRFSLSFHFDGWLPYPVTETFLVHRANVTLEQPEDGFCEENPYTNDLLETLDPAAKGNPETGQIVDGDKNFADPYTGTDYRFRSSADESCSGSN